jgi:hypothetical protein
VVAEALHFPARRQAPNLSTGTEKNSS